MRFGPLLTLVFAARAARFRIAQYKPAESALVKVPDSDPLRILIVGSGIALGFGVRTQDDALAGHIATELHRRLRRGMVVETKAAMTMPMSRMAAFLGVNGAHTYAAVVIVPDLIEGGTRRGHGWRSRVRALLLHVRATGAADVKVVVTGIPAPTRDDRAARTASEIIRRTNAAIEALVATEPGTAFAAVPSFESLTAKAPFDADYYRRASLGIADALESLLLPSRAAK